MVLQWDATRLATISSLKLPLQNQWTILPVHDLQLTLLLEHVILLRIKQLSWYAWESLNKHNTFVEHTHCTAQKQKCRHYCVCVAVGTGSHHAILFNVQYNGIAWGGILRCEIPVVCCSQCTIGEKVFRREHNRNIVLFHRVILSMTNYMFRPSGGHHQVYTSFWRAGFLFKNLYQPDDGHQMAETCSLSSIE
jgi:hypothetical protein